MMFPALHCISQEKIEGALIGRTFLQASPSDRHPHGATDGTQKTKRLPRRRNYFKGTKGDTIKVGPNIVYAACKWQVVTGPWRIKAPFINKETRGQNFSRKAALTLDDELVQEFQSGCLNSACKQINSPCIHGV